MKRTYNQAEIDLKWPEIWNDWPNKESENASKKAFSHLLKSGETLYETFELACRIYIGETRCNTYHQKLTTFIHEDHWKDMLEGCENPQEYADRLAANEAEARALIETWNGVCKVFWSKAINIDARIPIVLKSLSNQIFKEHWKKALDKLEKIFQYRPHEKDKFYSLKLTLKWFCDTSPDKFTVLQILEGEYGTPPREIVAPKPLVRKEELTEDELKELEDDWKEVFGTPLGEKIKLNSDAERPKGDDQGPDGDIQWL